jgi:pyruvate dehydrogenase (quinone)
VLHNPDLAKVARAMGAGGVRIEDPEDLRTKIAEAFDMPGRVVIDGLTNPDEIIIPPNAGPGQAWGFAITKIKETIRSRGDDD